MAWHTLELKSSKKCSLSIADDTLVGPCPFESTRIAFSWLAMFCCIFNKQRLKLAAWLHMTVDSRADFSHLRRFYCEMGRDMGGALAIPVCAVESGRSGTPRRDSLFRVFLRVGLKAIPLPL